MKKIADASKILVVLGNSFRKDQCYLKASVLTYYSLLSLVPLLAVALALATGFGYEEILRKQILESFSAQKEAISYALDFAKSLLQSSQNTIIAGSSTILLIWAILSLFGTVESSLNEIWKVGKGRSFWRLTSDCLLLLILCPIFLVISTF